MISLQQGGKNETIFYIYFYKQWFTEQFVLSLNTFSYSLNVLSDKKLMLKTLGSHFTL